MKKIILSFVVVFLTTSCTKESFDSNIEVKQSVKQFKPNHFAWKYGEIIYEPDKKTVSFIACIVPGGNCLINSSSSGNVNSIYNSLDQIDLNLNNTNLLKSILLSNYGSESPVVINAMKSNLLELNMVLQLNGLKDFVILNENKDIIYAYKNM